MSRFPSVIRGHGLECRSQPPPSPGAELSPGQGQFMTLTRREIRGLCWQGGRGAGPGKEHGLPNPFPLATATPGSCLGLQNLKQARQRQLTLAEHCSHVGQSAECLMRHHNATMTVMLLALTHRQGHSGQDGSTVKITDSIAPPGSKTSLAAGPRASYLYYVFHF